jgi:hypothetical protein
VSGGGEWPAIHSTSATAGVNHAPDCHNGPLISLWGPQSRHQKK